MNPFEDIIVREVKEGIPDWVRRLDIHKWAECIDWRKLEIFESTSLAGIYDSAF